MATNFTAFRFCDNDFHHDLKSAINYVVANRLEELTLESFKEFVIRGTIAFGLLSRIDNFNAKYPTKDYRQYIEETLEVSEVTRLEDLDDSFEGYVVDKHLVGECYYVGY